MNVYDLFADLAAEAARPDLAWMDEAACAEVGSDLWFPEQGGVIHAARRICMGCPVRTECLEYALNRDERWGIWGGLSEHQRRQMKRGRSEAA